MKNTFTFLITLLGAALAPAHAAEKPRPNIVVIYTDDRPGMLNQLTSALFNEGTNIRTLEAQPDASRSDGSALVNVIAAHKDKRADAPAAIGAKVRELLGK